MTNAVKSPEWLEVWMRERISGISSNHVTP
nr:MAG TPA: hypothetical protein [Caudoviricetes sp.]